MDSLPTKMLTCSRTWLSSVRMRSRRPGYRAHNNSRASRSSAGEPGISTSPRPAASAGGGPGMADLRSCRFRRATGARRRSQDGPQDRRAGLERAPPRRNGCFRAVRPPPAGVYRQTADVVRRSPPRLGNALTRVCGSPYHGNMAQRQQIAVGSILFAVLGLAGGCEDAARKTTVRAPVPATALKQANPPAAATATAPHPPALPPLPLPKRRPLLMLPLPLRGTKEDLVARVEQKFASGEQNYKAGPLEAARKDFDDAVDWMLGSGYDLNGDAKLSELFRRVVDTVYADELQAFRAGDGFQEAPAVPAAVDEVAGMTLQVDPRLKARAEEAAKNISHDLPLTVNDEVLSFLHFFHTPRGRAIVDTR